MAKIHWGRREISSRIVEQSGNSRDDKELKLTVLYKHGYIAMRILRPTVVLFILADRYKGHGANMISYSRHRKVQKWDSCSMMLTMP